MIFLISASQIARIIGMSHLCLALLCNYTLSLLQLVFPLWQIIPVSIKYCISSIKNPNLTAACLSLCSGPLDSWL
jgi:hypothetical protein